MAKKANDPDPGAPPPGPGHNDPPAPLTPEQRADLLLVHLKRHRAIDKQMEDALEVVRGIRKQRNRHRAVMKTDGFQLKYVDEVLHDEKKARHEADADAQNRTFIRHVARQPVTGQQDEDQLDLFTAKTSKGDVTLDNDDAYWAGRAMTVALRGGEVDAAKNEVPPERLQAWEQGLEAGYARIMAAAATAAEIEKRREPA